MTLYFEKLNLCVHSIHASVYIFVCVRMCVWWFPDEFEKYCNDVEHTAAWGGQLEVSCSSFVTDSLYWCPFYFSIIPFLFQLRALTQFLHLPIEVIQAGSATIKIGEEFDGEPITLVYVYINMFLRGSSCIIKFMYYVK